MPKNPKPEKTKLKKPPRNPTYIDLSKLDYLDFDDHELCFVESKELDIKRVGFDPTLATLRLIFRVPAKCANRVSRYQSHYTSVSVMILPDLPKGYAVWHKFSVHLEYDLLYEVDKIIDILWELRLCGAVGDFASLEKHMPPNPEKPKWAQRVDPAKPETAKLAMALLKGPERTRSSRKPKSNSVDSGKDRKSRKKQLADAYVEWAEKLLDDEKMRIFGRGRRSICSRKALDAFEAFTKQTGVKYASRSRWDDQIRKTLEADKDLMGRLVDVIDKSRTLMK